MRGRKAKLPACIVLQQHNIHCNPNTRKLTIHAQSVRFLNWNHLPAEAVKGNPYFRRGSADSFLIMNCTTPCCEAQYALPMAWVKLQLYFDRMAEL